MTCNALLLDMEPAAGADTLGATTERTLTGPLRLGRFL
jgi:hypothetical protein